jgi:hypothetical protein
MFLVVSKDSKYSVEYDLPNRMLVAKAFGRVETSHLCIKNSEEWSLKQGDSWKHFGSLVEAAGFVLDNLLATVRTGKGEQS